MDAENDGKRRKVANKSDHPDLSAATKVSISRLQERIRILEEGQKKLTTEIETLRTENAKLVAQDTALSSAVSQCATEKERLNTELSGKNREIDKFKEEKKEVADKQAEIDGLTRKIFNLEKEKRHLTEQLTEKEQKITRLTKTDEEIATFQVEKRNLNEKEIEITRLRANIQAEEKKTRRLTEELSEKTQKIRELSKTEKEIDDWKREKKEYTDDKNEIEKLRRELGDKETKTKMLTDEVAEKKKKIAELTKTTKELGETTKKHEDETAKDYLKFKIYLQQARDYIVPVENPSVDSMIENLNKSIEFFTRNSKPDQTDANRQLSRLQTLKKVEELAKKFRATQVRALF